MERDSSSSDGSSGSMNEFWLPRNDAERVLVLGCVDVDRSGMVCVCRFK